MTKSENVLNSEHLFGCTVKTYEELARKKYYKIIKRKI